jgi:uncharacterized membrane protein
MLKAISITGVALCLSLYPLIVYFGLQYTSIEYISLILIALVATRLVLSHQLLKRLPWLLPASILSVILLGTAWWFKSEVGLLLYPVIINLVMAITFTFSLFIGPPVIETFARIREPGLDEKGVKYTRKVTKVWCLFFVLNGSVALYTSLFTSLATWTLYNGLIAYILIAGLMAIEWLIRKKVKNSVD